MFRFCSTKKSIVKDWFYLCKCKLTCFCNVFRCEKTRFSFNFIFIQNPHLEYVNATAFFLLLIFTGILSNDCRVSINAGEFTIKPEGKFLHSDMLPGKDSSQITALCLPSQNRAHVNF